MAYTLKCNVDNFLELTDFEVGDINWFNRNEIPPQDPKGAYWHTKKGTGLNALTIYNYLTSNGYTVPSYSLTLANVEAAWNGDETILNEFEHNFYWLVGDFSAGFGVCFCIAAANQISVIGFYYDPDAHSVTTYGASDWADTSVSVSSGETDNIVYFVDYLYDEGVVNLEEGLNPQSGRYEVTVREDLQREWYYYNNIDMIIVNDSDSAWETLLLKRKVPYYSPHGGTGDRNPWHDIARNSPYTTRPDPFKYSGAPTQPDGGNGETRVSVDIDHPTAPPDMLLASGIVKMYKPNSQQMNDLMNYIYSTSEQIAVNFKKIWNDPMQSIIALSILPFDVPAADTTEVVKFCGISTNVSMNPLASQFYEIEIGDLKLSEETNSFLDYSSYTKVKASLPFIGIVDMNTDDVMDATLNLKYIIDLESGDCVASIKCTKTRDTYGIDYSSALYSFNGNCIAQAPLSGNNWQGLYNGTLRLAASLFNSMGSGNVAGAAISTGVDFLTSNKVDVKRSGSISGNASHLGQYVPYLIVECPIVSTTPDMYERQGYPWNRTKTVEYMNNWKNTDTNEYGSGYTVFQKNSVFVDNINATDSEKQAIKNILESGVIFNPRPNK